jgi:transposase-like protein
MDDEIKLWAARRKSALVLEITQGKTTVAEASRAYDLPPSEIEKWLVLMAVRNRLFLAMARTSPR